jgi:glucokinase
VYLTISTGIGGGIIINNNLISGAGGLAGEFGHITILPDGPICSCGQLGHLEALSSGTAIAKYVEEKLAQGVVSTIKPNSELTAYEVSLAAQADDSLAQEAQERAVKYLGLAIANFIHIFNPSMIVLGGGVLNFGKKFMEQIQKAVERSVISNEYIKDLKITRAKLGDNSGLMGALALAHTSSTMLDN